jgi:serine/threonine protein kinase
MSLAQETLGDRLVSLGKRDENEARVIFRGIAHGIEYLHSALHVANRDLKCQNIPLDRCNHAKTADFGCAHVLDNVDALNALKQYCLELTSKDGIHR